MSLQVTFNTRTISPTMSLSKDGDKEYYNATVFEPIRYGLSISDMSPNPDQLKAVLKDCAEKGIDCEIEYNQVQRGNFKSFEVFSVKPLPKAKG